MDQDIQQHVDAIASASEDDGKIGGHAVALLGIFLTEVRGIRRALEELASQRDRAAS